MSSRVEYKTLRFKDNRHGRSDMDKTLNKLGGQGWRVVDDTVKDGRRSVTRTVGLGVVFLPLAIKGKKSDTIIVTMEREV